MVAAGSKERLELNQTIQDDKKGMAVTGEGIGAPLEEIYVEMNSVIVDRKPEEELINQDVPIERL